jgi:hypothetical protein
MPLEHQLMINLMNEFLQKVDLNEGMSLEYLLTLNNFFLDYYYSFLQFYHLKLTSLNLYFIHISIQNLLDNSIQIYMSEIISNLFLDRCLLNETTFHLCSTLVHFP